VDEAAGDAGDEEGVVDLKLDGVLELLVTGLEHGVEALGLGHGTGEAVEDESGRDWELVLAHRSGIDGDKGSSAGDSTRC